MVTTSFPCAAGIALVLTDGFKTARSEGVQSSEQPATNFEKVASRRLVIVLAEDNQADVLLVREALAHHRVDADLIHRRDGDEMHSLIEQMDRGEASVPDLILLDLNLPRRTGDLLLAQIRATDVLDSVPVVIVTSSDSPRDREMATGLRATGYFRKPSDYDEFLELGALVKRVTNRASA